MPLELNFPYVFAGSQRHDDNRERARRTIPMIMMIVMPA